MAEGFRGGWVKMKVMRGVGVGMLARTAGMQKGPFFSEFSPSRCLIED